MTSPDENTGRLVLLEDIDAMVIDHYRRRAESSADRLILDTILRQRDAAPDPAEAVRAACWEILNGYVSPNHSQEVATAVLVALGANEPATGGDDA